MRVLLTGLLLLLPTAAGVLPADASCELDPDGLLVEADVASCTVDDLVAHALLVLNADADARTIVEVNVLGGEVDDDLVEHYEAHVYASDARNEAVVLLYVVRGPLRDTEASLIVARDTVADRSVQGTLFGTSDVAATTVSVPACPSDGSPVYPSWSQGSASTDPGGACIGL